MKCLVGEMNLGQRKSVLEIYQYIAIKQHGLRKTKYFSAHLLTVDNVPKKWWKEWKLKSNDKYASQNAYATKHGWKAWKIGLYKK